MGAWWWRESKSKIRKHPCVRMDVSHAMSKLFSMQYTEGNKHVKQINEVDVCCDLKVGDLEAREAARPSVCEWQ